jgi:hypothetical protein
MQSLSEILHNLTLEDLGKRSNGVLHSGICFFDRSSTS